MAVSKTIILLSALIIIFYTSCSKPGSSCNAGTGGSVILNFVAQHHGKPVVSRAQYLDSVFIKFNALNYPGPYPSDYDLVVAGTVGTNYINVSGMQCGQYYIKMTGFDTAYNKRVVDGIPVNFTDKSGTVQFIIPISESNNN